MTLYGAILLTVVVVLHTVSVKRGGIGDDNGRAAMYFGWRFTPTLLAVVYVTMLMILLDAVKRTEAFARLASGTALGADASILRHPGAWWTAVMDSFPRKKNERHFSPTMLCTAIAYTLGSLVISPLSAALLTSQNVIVSSPTTFLRVQLPSDPLIRPELNTLEYFHKIGHILQNVTTSPWIMDDFTILPFWPDHMDRPSGSRFDSSTEDWEAESLIFQSDIACEELKLIGQPTIIKVPWNNLGNDSTVSPEYRFINITSQLLRMNSGCEYGFSYDQWENFSEGAARPGSVFWTNVSKLNFQAFGSPSEYPEKTDHLVLNYTSQCEPGEVVIVITAQSTDPDVHVGGQLCRPSF
jgi:hypothetical protein